MENECQVIADQPSSHCEATPPTANESIATCYPMSTPLEPPVSQQMSVSQQIPIPQEMAIHHQMLMPQYIPVTQQPPVTLHHQFAIFPHEQWHTSSQIPTRRQVPINHQIHPQYIEGAVISKFGPLPAKITCPYCTTAITSKVKFEASYKTHMIAFILCLLCCFIFVWLPYCIDACKVQKHYCPNCNGYLGAYYKHRFYGYNRFTGNMGIVEM